MRVAIASDHNVVASHFGECQGFTIFDVLSDKVLKQFYLASPGHRPGFLPTFLHDQEVELVIVGGICENAIKLLNHNNIDVIIGAKGDVLDVINSYLNRTLKSDDSACLHHHCE